MVFALHITTQGLILTAPYDPLALSVVIPEHIAQSKSWAFGGVSLQTETKNWESEQLYIVIPSIGKEEKF